MDVTLSAPQGAYYHVDVIHLLPLLGIKKGAWGYSTSGYTNSVPAQHALYPFGQRTFAFYTKCITSVG